MKPTPGQDGYIALTAVIIVAVVLLVFTISLASSGFYTRFVVFDSEVKEVSRAYAEGCIQTAMLEYEKDNSYSGNDDIVWYDQANDRKCTIHSVSGSPANLRIQTQAEVNNVFTNLDVVLNATNDYAIVSWEEKASL